MLGGLSVESPAAPLSGAATQRRRLALLAVIAGAGDRGISRDKLLAYLWPEGDPEKARRVLAQALYALRRDLGSDELFLGSTELRLNPEVLPSDYAEFKAAIAAQRLETAVGLYGGPLLDGFYLNDAPEFERWVDTERAALAADYAHALESLAERAREQGDTRASVGWWRKLAAVDPLNNRVSLRLMQALAAAGDRAGALQHARVFETLLQQELEVPPDRSVLDYVQELRRPESAAPAATVAAPGVAASAPEIRAPQVASPPVLPRAPGPEHLSELGVTSGWATAASTLPPPPQATRLPVPARAPRAPMRALLVAAGVVVLLVLAYLGLRPATEPSTETPALPIVAVGRFQDYTGEAGLVRPLSDMLATNLARASGLRVVSSARMYELMAQGDRTADSAAAVVQAARQAGATELIEGALYRTGGRLRLDLRRTDLASGSVRVAYTVTGNDLFEVVESGSQELVSNLGTAISGAPLNQVTTRSLLAYRLYEEGLRAFYNGDPSGAFQLFQSALKEDSTFAMAQFYAAFTNPNGQLLAELEKAIALSDHASDRERLLIRGGWATQANDPSAVAIAETLTVRYPTEPEGFLFMGSARISAGDFAGALGPLRQVTTMDSLSLKRPFDPRERRVRCLACEAISGLVFAYGAMDSMETAERIARDWTRMQPGHSGAWLSLAEILIGEGRLEDALAAYRSYAALTPGADQDLWRALARFRTGDFSEAERLLEARVREGTGGLAGQARVWLIHTYRAEGRFKDALAVADEILAIAGPEPTRGALRYDALYKGAVLLNMGEYRHAAALFDSVSRRQTNEGPSRTARNKTWTQTLRATALALAGDTALLPQIADSVRVYGSRSGYGRDQLLHHHVRGLILAARGNLSGAEAEFRAAIYSPTIGYNRNNIELAKVLLRQNRPLEAGQVLESTMHGSYDASNTYATPTELWELAALAYDNAGVREKAVTYYRRVIQGWAAADPELAPRVERARLRLAALTGQRAQ